MRQLNRPPTVALAVVALFLVPGVTLAQDTNLDLFLRTQLLGTETQAAYCAETMPELKNQIQSSLEAYKASFVKVSTLIAARFEGSEYVKHESSPMDALTADPKTWALDIPKRAGPQVFCPWFLTSITDRTPEYFARILGDVFEQLQVQAALGAKRLESENAGK